MKVLYHISMPLRMILKTVVCKKACNTYGICVAGSEYVRNIFLFLFIVLMILLSCFYKELPLD